MYRLPEYKKNVADIEKENEALEGLKAKLDGASLTQKDKIKKSIRKSKAKVKSIIKKCLGSSLKAHSCQCSPLPVLLCCLVPTRAR